MWLIIGIHSISVTWYNSIYVVFFLLPTCNIYRDLTVHVRILRFSFINLRVYSINPSYMIGNFHGIVNYSNIKLEYQGLGPCNVHVGRWCHCGSGKPSGRPKTLGRGWQPFGRAGPILQIGWVRLKYAGTHGLGWCVPAPPPKPATKNTI